MAELASLTQLTLEGFQDLGLQKSDARVESMQWLKVEEECYCSLEDLVLIVNTLFKLTAGWITHQSCVIGFEELGNRPHPLAVEEAHIGLKVVSVKLELLELIL